MIAGDWAPVLGLENELRAVYVSSEANCNVNNLHLIRPDYIVVLKDTAQERMLKERYPRVLERGVVVARFDKGPFHAVVKKVAWRSE